MMQDKKSAHPTAATVERAGLDAEAWQATASNSKFTTPAPTGARVHIADFLLPGQQNAVPLKRLKELLDLDGRTIRLMIRSERLHGTPILADCVGGYFLPDSDHERARCVQRLRHRAAEIAMVADTIAAADIPEEAAAIGK